MWVLGGYKNVVDDFRRPGGRLLMSQEFTGSKRSSADVFVAFESINNHMLYFYLIGKWSPLLKIKNHYKDSL